MFWDFTKNSSVKSLIIKEKSRFFKSNSNFFSSNKIDHTWVSVFRHFLGCLDEKGLPSIDYKLVRDKTSGVHANFAC